MKLPIIILVRPQLGENIGAVGRAMANFGLSELRIVAPRDGWPNTKALEMASDGKSIVEAARIFPDLVSAMHDIQIAYATTARPRDMEKRVVTPEVAMAEIDADATRYAFVFGPERTGLENEEIVMCDTLITIPTDPKKSSLNLGQSAVVVLYEWFTCHPERAGGESKDLRHGKVIDPSTSSLRDSAQDDKLATKKDWQGLFDQLESCLDEVNYYRTAHKKPVMWQNMKNMLLRGAWNEQEVRTFRGMLRILWEGRKPRRK